MSENQQYRGLSDAQVAESRKAHGANILTPPEREPLWRKFLDKFSDPLIIILLVAGVLSVGISCYEYWGLGHQATVFFEPVGIFIAILLATGLSFVFELKADREFTLLNQVNDDEPVKVLRNGALTEVPRKDIVVGDIVMLNTGDEVPADGHLLDAVSLMVDESSLTGEPSCNKTIDPSQFDPNATYPSNEVMRGTNVMDGHGIMEVDRVGDATENGRVFVDAQIDNSVKTPLTEQLDRLGKLVSVASYLIGGLVVVGRCLMYAIENGVEMLPTLDFAAYFLQTVMIAVTLIVVAVPEGLPMAITLSLAYSMRRMLKTNNLVRKLHACETMGAATVICTDKTGTLTRNQMRVAEARFPGLPASGLLDGSRESRLVAEAIAVNSTASLELHDGSKPKVLGNPTEGALLLWLNDQGIDYNRLRGDSRRIDELTFSTERKYMATIVESDVTGKPMLYVKGAPEIVLAMCSTVAPDNNPIYSSLAGIEEALAGCQEQAMRTLGFACKSLDSADGVIADGRLTVEGLEFMGFVAINDPVRDDVPAAVNEVLDACIAVKIVTGDTPRIAREIARRIGLWNDSDKDETGIITGPEFAALSDRELGERIDGIKIISRARPGDKKRLVETLQSRGEVVAVTGDGTNDAPALNAAHVGLSMGDGTSVAKEASDITIIDNSFASIGRAVMWGRSLYLNLQRFVIFQLTVNVAACFIVLAGAFMGTESPLTVTQMLWVNLIMDTFAAVALASIAPSAAVMKSKPRNRRDFIITTAMRNDILGVGLIFFLLLIGLLYIFEHSEITSLTDMLHLNLTKANKGLSPYELSLFFTFFVFLQFWNLLNVRAYNTGRSAFHLKGCGGFNLIIFIIFAGQILIVETGREFFNVVPLLFSDWVIIIASTSLVLWIGELSRLLHKKSQ